MTALAVRDRAKFNAALAIIHDHGHSANAISQAARIHIAKGWDASRSFKTALDDFAKQNPALTPKLRQVIRVIEASDDPTVARYDAAVSQYIETGDISVMDAIAPTFARDSIALALRNGELSPDAIGTPEALGIAMGFDPGPEGQAALTAAPAGSPAAAPQAAARAETPAPARQTFRFGERPANSVASTSASASVVPVATGGVRSRMSPEREAEWNAPLLVGHPSGRPLSGRGFDTPLRGEQAARWAGYAPAQPHVKTERGYRAPMTGEKWKRWAGVPVTEGAQEPASEGA